MLLGPGQSLINTRAARAKRKTFFDKKKKKKGGQRSSPMCLATAPHNLGNETKPELMFALQQHSPTATLTLKIKH